ncbi:hypothetical protein [Desulfoluna spongiiphila]|uniref:hypothetical protein n=1 Tax=Desulfoluna spongiiphila TaxID=419481 RepID=UPI00125C3025|nr:hypothetical protein [Desulfoluna spongiiphila]VVS91048.1 hypothetical protein DBB_6160 [Desulfoluna spongiiphila]
MKYSFDYQYMPKGAARPYDDGVIVGTEIKDPSELVLLPNVGDYVNIENSMEKTKRESFSGKVRSKLFNYTRLANNEIHCGINIVVEETDDDFSKLIKE